MLLPISNVTLDKLNSPLLSKKEVNLSVLRLDKIDQEVSGNKLFKLHYFVEACLQSSHKTILTFGGAYSNHLAATAFLCYKNNLKCIGLIRGEASTTLSHTLIRCKELGMQLVFLSRAAYKKLDTEVDEHLLLNTYGPCTIIPEGGFAKDGANGASLIMNLLKNEVPTHICTCVGTGTTLSGMLNNNAHNAAIVAVPAIKNMTDIEVRILQLTSKAYKPIIFNDYHFGGYAKYNNQLIAFMNSFYAQYNIPTDFVYTAKLMYGIFDKIEQNYFAKGSKIICLHTGGLQGNKSLDNGLLIF